MYFRSRNSSFCNRFFPHRFISSISPILSIIAILTIVVFLSGSSVFAVPAGYDYKPVTDDPHAQSSEASQNPYRSSSVDQRYNLDSLATFQFTGFNGSDVWGWESPDGDQYAIMGVNEGIVFVNVSTMTIVDTITAVGGPCLWQDIKTYRNFAYSVSECSGNGLMVMDMSFLPDSVHFVQSVVLATDSVDQTLFSSHNLSIDTATGFAYIEGVGGNLNILIHDLADPANPQWVGFFGDRPQQIHDMYVRNDTAYVADGGTSFSIWDVSDKQNPQLLSRWQPPNSGYTHNIWPTDDGKRVVTTEETPGRTVKLWNIEDFDDVKLEAEYLAPNQLAHNAHIEGDFVYLSHYESGVIVLDISQSGCIQEVASFDTWVPSDRAIFNGNWGVYPHGKDSLVFATNFDGRMFILKMREDPAIPILDSDADLIRDFCDNCPSVVNPLQVDDDLDGIGDVCGAPLKVTIDDELAVEPVVRWIYSSSPLITGYDVYLARLDDSALICGIPNEQPIWGPEHITNGSLVSSGEFTLTGLIDGAVYGIGVAVHFDVGDPRISPAKIFRYGAPHTPAWNDNFANSDQAANSYLSNGPIINLSWTPDFSDVDLVSYNIYRFDPEAPIPICLRELEPFATVLAPLTEFSQAEESSTKYNYVVTTVDGQGTESSNSTPVLVYTHPTIQKQIAVIVFDTLRGSWAHGDSVYNYYNRELAGYDVDVIAQRVRRKPPVEWPPKYSELGDYKTLYLDGADRLFTFRGASTPGLEDHIWLQDFTRSGGTLIYVGSGVALGTWSLTSNVINTLFSPVSVAGQFFGIEQTSLTSIGEHLTSNEGDSLYRYFQPQGPPAEAGSGFPDLSYQHSGFYRDTNLTVGAVPLKGVITPRADVASDIEPIYHYVSGRNPVSGFDGGVVGMKYAPATHTAYTFLMHPWEMAPDEQSAFFAALLGDVQTAVGDDQATPVLPEVFTLSQNYPNPFNPTTTISYSLPVKSHVQINVYNILGQRVTQLVDVEQSPGAYTVKWDGASVASGIYFYKLQAGDVRISKKMVLLK